MARPQIIGDSAETIDGVPEDEELEDGEEWMQTSVGRFKFSIDQLPQPLQYIQQLLTVNVSRFGFSYKCIKNLINIKGNIKH